MPPGYCRKLALVKRGLGIQSLLCEDAASQESVSVRTVMAVNSSFGALTARGEFRPIENKALLGHAQRIADNLVWLLCVLGLGTIFLLW
jgi:hypothetical protein